MDDARKFSLKDKIKRYFCFSCCFSANRRETLHSDSPSFSNDNNNRPMLFIGASSQWIKSQANSIDIPEIKDKCRNMFGRIGGQNHRRRRSSTDFKYDPLSYALNFEEDSYEDDAQVKDFSSRLPSSPSHESTVSIKG